ncbi:MAG: hypothetical protein MUP47_01780 [Phycisphaerae bacterium]|nr:hypothetical protein [Phycisphaerae bacterium]
MVRRLSTDGWKALPLVAMAVGGLMWHVLACVESPMAFAPNGDLAFTVMEPYGQGQDQVLCGTHTYRLMLLPAGADQPKVLEESSHWMISAPAFSGDGQRIAYFRIPLLTAESLSGTQKALKGKQESLPVPTSRPSKSSWPQVAEWPVGPELRILLEAGASVAEVSSFQEPGPPSIDSLFQSYRAALATPLVPAQLVERRTWDGEVTSITWIGLPLAVAGDVDQGDLSNVLLLAYVLGRPAYSLDGQWVYFCPGSLEGGGMVLAVNPSSKVQRLLAPGALAASLSPDGKTLAVLQEGALAFVRTDGSVTSTVRCETRVSHAGLVWADNDTVALLRADKIADKNVRTLSFVRADGALAKTVALPEMDTGKEDDPGQLALSPDGRYLVVAFNEMAYFLDSRGTLLGGWNGSEKGLLAAQPTFTPDGKQVVFKLVQKVQENAGLVVAIAFFSPAGQELRRVNITPIHPPQTQPAESQPTSPPAPPEPPVLKPQVILELPPPVEGARPLTGLPTTAPATRPAPTSAPALNREQEKALEEMTPELP